MCVTSASTWHNSPTKTDKIGEMKAPVYPSSIMTKCSEDIDVIQTVRKPKNHVTQLQNFVDYELETMIRSGKTNLQRYWTDSIRCKALIPVAISVEHRFIKELIRNSVLLKSAQRRPSQHQQLSMTVAAISILRGAPFSPFGAMYHHRHRSLLARVF
ncbi:hypothetical protein T265_00130 [Opisthorchis viverrini]|uniref:Uncharacterized protein n=1 Tax=Opisthorchis viverrini TaxID=6198 RepID=A0A075A3N5_OPIVI|nr:hypothetical protein T265_00130 [Opisthorchis viverrini]KER34283.1 hypothetical protein T265_00130 [Opisthorchis viverrini]